MKAWLWLKDQLPRWFTHMLGWCCLLTGEFSCPPCGPLCRATWMVLWANSWLPSERVMPKRDKVEAIMSFMTQHCKSHTILQSHNRWALLGMERTTQGWWEMIISNHLGDWLPQAVRVERALNEKSGHPGSSLGSGQVIYPLWASVFSLFRHRPVEV